MSVTKVGRREKNFKKHWLKRPKEVPPKNEFWTKIQMIQNLRFGILFLKYYFGHITFLYSSAHPSGHDQNFFFQFQIF